MRTSICAGLLAFAASFVSGTAGAAPPAPVITVGANDIKQLQFDIGPVPGAITYELWFRPNAGSAWVKYTTTPAQHPLIRINVSVHLLDWRVARYRVAACNPSGCTNSNEVGVADLALDAMGYFKPLLVGKNKWFGSHVAASADGKTLAVMTGETLGSTQNSVVIHIYRKTTATSGWRRELRFAPSKVQPNTNQPYIGSPLSLSSDGNVLAVGVFNEFVPGAYAVGAAYVFRRDGTGWHQEQRFASVPQSNIMFGQAVDLDDAGKLLAVMHRSTNDGGRSFGLIDIYRHDGAAWVFERTLGLPNLPNVRCDSLSVSGDGRTLFRNCGVPGMVQVFDTSTWVETARLSGAGRGGAIDSTADGSKFVSDGGNSAFVYKQSAGIWSREGELLGGDWGQTNKQFISISRDGKIVAGGDVSDNRLGKGPLYPPYTYANAINTGGIVAIWDLRSTGWIFRRYVKPGSSHAEWFGSTVALGDNGRLLLVGALTDPSNATGINGNPEDDSEPERGAAWLY